MEWRFGEPAPRHGGTGARACADRTGCACWWPARKPRRRPARNSAARPRSCPHATAISGCATPARSLPEREHGAVALRFRTNGWGGKFDLPDDATVGDDIARLAGAPVRKFDFVLEGGAIEHDGEGTILTTRQTAAQRQSQWLDGSRSRSRAARSLRREARSSGSTKASLNDHTDGHIDNIARFVGAGPRGVPIPCRRRRPQCRHPGRDRARRSKRRRDARGPQARSDPHPDARPGRGRRWAKPRPPRT